MTASMERLCDWVVNKDKVWVHGDRITDGHVALDMRLTPGLDPGEVDRDGQWVLRKAQPSRWVAEQHPDLSDVIPDPADGSDWSEVVWSHWVTRSLRIGALRGAAVAVDHGWLSRLDPGYRIEGAPGRRALRIVTKVPELSLLSGGAAHRTVVGVVMPTSIEASGTVLEAIVQDLNV
ncbi:hypothetical protein AB0D14_35925 [Streptomyces sp. NPDC048484]|uniref:hypothetical protein n=1 Tax=Streptomyces sp. NPDC048484 TaxID=3155146 RepID=UPI00342C1870